MCDKQVYSKRASHIHFDIYQRISINSQNKTANYEDTFVYLIPQCRLSFNTAPQVPIIRGLASPIIGLLFHWVAPLQLSSFKFTCWATRLGAFPSPSTLPLSLSRSHASQLLSLAVSL